MAQSPTARDLIEAGLSRSFAHHVAAGTRHVGIPLALWLKDECGITVKAIADKTKRELELLRSMYPPRAPEKVVERRAAVLSARQDAAA